LRLHAPATGTWAKEHHHAAIARIHAEPYVTAQPIARYWYADMLSERGRHEDVEAAKAQPHAAMAASDAIGLGLYARLARQNWRESGERLEGNVASAIRDAGSPHKVSLRI